MTATEKIKIINNKIEQNKAQYKLYRQNAKISAYEFSRNEKNLLEKRLLEKAATIKRFEYSPLDRKLKKQADIGKKQDQELYKVYEFDGTINKDVQKPTLKKYSKAELIYDTVHSFYKYCDIKKFNNLSLESKYSFLPSFSNDLDKFSRSKNQKEKTK